MHDISQTKKNYSKLYFTIVYFSYSPWNVLLSHLNGERTMSKGWVNDERTLNERWANAEWTMSERWTQVGERYVNAERWANAERKRSANASAMWTVNARWTHNERFIRKVSGIFIALYLTSLVGIYMYELSNFVILFKRTYFLYKRTVWNRNYLYMSKRDLHTQNKLIIKINSWFYHPAL